MEPYLLMASEAGASVFILDLFDGGLTDEQLFERNDHGVPLETIQAMRSRWEHDWKKGNPQPPWEREEKPVVQYKPNEWVVALEEAIEVGIAVGDEPKPKLKPEFLRAVQTLTPIAKKWAAENQRHFERDENNTRLETDTTEDEE
jgi:hypothetical protein